MSATGGYSVAAAATRQARAADFVVIQLWAPSGKQHGRRDDDALSYSVAAVLTSVCM